MNKSTFGPAYDKTLDSDRLEHQYERIRNFMLDDQWRSLAEISTQLGYPESSVSANLRHLRKEQFGGHTVNKRRRLDHHGIALGSWEYQVKKPVPFFGQMVFL